MANHIIIYLLLRCAVANMLVTNCSDNISRLWCETVLPDDGLVSLQQLDPAATQVEQGVSYELVKSVEKNLNRRREEGERLGKEWVEERRGDGKSKSHLLPLNVNYFGRISSFRKMEWGTLRRG